MPGMYVNNKLLQVCQRNKIAGDPTKCDCY